MSDPRPPPAHRRNFWSRRLAEPIARQLTQGVSQEKIALTLAVGSAVALFPVLGTTTLLCLAAGIVLKLNQPLIQGINVLCGFIWIPLFIVFVRLGDRLTLTASAGLDIPAVIALSHHPLQFLRQSGVMVVHAVFGWLVVVPFWIPLAYFLAQPPLRAAARRIPLKSP